MSNNASTPQEGRNTWASRYPFEPVNGGKGAALAVTVSSARVALVGAGTNITTGLVACVTNWGSQFVFVAFGDSSIVADTGSYAIGPGIQVLLSMPAAGAPGNNTVPGYMAAVTGTGTSNVQVCLGYGN